MTRWTETFEQHARKAGSARAHVTSFAASGPLGALLSLVLGLLALALFLVLLIPIIAIGLVSGLIFLLYIKIRAMFRRVGSPNSHIGPVRTAGRSNVRVIGRDSDTP